MPSMPLLLLMLLTASSIALLDAMLIPGDTEILPGYVMDEPQSDVELDGGASDLFYEMRSLTGDDRMPIRNRRAIATAPQPGYRVLPSPGLRSHFAVDPARRQDEAVVVKRVLHAEQRRTLHHRSSSSSNADEGDAKAEADADYMQNIAYVNLRPPPRMQRQRHARSVETMDQQAPVQASSDELHPDDAADNEGPESVESLPTALRLTVLPEEYAADQNEAAAASTLVHSWHDGKYLYAKTLPAQQPVPAMGPPATATSNEGIRSRMPRVHFITQKQQPEEKAMTTSSLATLLAGGSKSALRSAPQKRDDRYSGSLGGSADFRHDFVDDVYERSFDGYDREMLLQPDSYLRSSYPDYAPPTRAPTYADYFYSERRFDLPPPPSPLPPLPLYREPIMSRSPAAYYPDDRGYLPSHGAAVDMRPPRNRRIIYYATLPEIVRAPLAPTVAPLDAPSLSDQRRYRNNGYAPSRYDYLPAGAGSAGGGGGLYEYDRYYRSVRAEKPTAAQLDAADRRNKLNKKQFLDGSVRIASGLTVNDAPNGKAATAKPAALATGGAVTRRPTTEYGRYY